MLARRAGHKAAVAGEDLHLFDGLVHEAESERRRFDADAAYRAANGDGLELGHYGGQQAVRQRAVGEGLVRGHALDVGGQAVAVDAQDVMEIAHIDTAFITLIAMAEEVRRRFGKADRRAGCARGFERPHQPFAAALVLVHRCRHRTGVYDGTSPFDITSCHNCILRARKPPAEPRT